MIRVTKYIATILYLVFFCFSETVFSQECSLPILSAFDNPTISGIDVSWLDFNTAAAWEIEFGPKGFDRDEVPDIVNLSQKTYTFQNLDSGITYELYIRAQCATGTSDWNGPYFFNTVIDADNSCGLDLAISDDRCPLADVFFIDINGYDNFLLGDNLVLDQVEILINHPWPPDLDIKLKSPQGIEIPISIHNGNSGADDYGDISIENCEGALIFSDNACENIANVSPPFVGVYQPESPLSDLFTGESPNGFWELHICDRASGDIGFLEYINLNFSESSCIVPPAIRVIDVEATEVTLAWDDFENCETLEIVFRKVSEPTQLSSSRFVLCAESTFTIVDLDASEDYVILVTSSCGSGGKSPESCEIFFRTSCGDSNFIENWDAQSLCELSCDTPCLLNSLWQNAKSNKSNWLVNTGPTPTSFTGPSGDTRTNGKYVYIENQSERCSEPETIHLISPCLTSLDGECDLTISYHLYGRDVGKLAIETSIDSLNWREQWSVEGDQGDVWNTTSIDINDNFQRGLVRISAYKREGSSRGDMALDDIKIIGLDTIRPLTYYADADGDGFGDPNSALLICSDALPIGYALNANDCDDTSASIYPGAAEIRCNQIDENCNGDMDDASIDDINYVIGAVRNESCVGLEDGSITIQAFNGLSPYSYQWSNGHTGSTITGLSTGIYFCTISDVGGCQSFTDPVFVGFDNIIVYSVKEIINPSCFGVEDGVLEILLEGGVPPYSVVWSNGRQGSRVSQLSDGKYNATITDALDCNVIIDSLELIGPKILTSGVVLKRDNDCFQDSSGFIQLGVFGGVAPYDILWNTNANTNIINNLKAGSYTVTVTDQNGCKDIVNNISIEQPDSINIALNNVEHISCHGEANSLVDISVQGGTEPFSYFWSDGSNSQDLINKPSGTYTVTVSDVNSCVSVLGDIRIDEPNEIIINPDSLVNVNCIGSDGGFIRVTVNGGNAPYSYNWGVFDGSTMQTDSLVNLKSGQYSLTVVDAFNCKSSAYTAEILNINIPIDVNLEVLSHVDCFGDSTGHVLAEINNGVLPFDYNWSNGQKMESSESSDTLTSVIAGQYNLTLTDSEGCIGVADSIVVLTNSMLDFQLDKFQNNLCWGESSGEIALSLDGATPPYSLEWSNGMDAENISGLANGFYTVTITDNLKCEEVIGPYEIISPSPLELDINVLNPNANALGRLTLDPTGGTQPYAYVWGMPLQSLDGPIADNLVEGSYSVVVIDDNGCRLDTLINLQTTSVHNVLTSTIDVFPNPTSSQLSIKLDNADFGTINQVSLYSLEGLVLTQSVNNLESVKLDINTSAGVYVLAIDTTRNHRFYRKVIVY